MMNIEESVLTDVTPDEEERERTLNVVKELVGRIRSDPIIINNSVEVKLVGSVAKDTYLNKPDLDIFLIFPPTFDFETMVRISSNIGKPLLVDAEERFADHPYIHGKYYGYEVDLVPCFKIKYGEKVISAVDRTPLHTEYIIKNMRREQRPQVRLLKAFMKGVGTYGADSRVRGFSGYLCELLILNYGDFESVLRGASAWKFGEVIGDVGDTVFNDPLVVIDPVDKGRNVASAISIDTMSLFIHASREYLHSPDIRFFFPRQRGLLSIEEAMRIVKERGTKIAMVRFPFKQFPEDALFAQAYKTEKGLRDLLEKADFRPLRSAFDINEHMTFIFELESDRLPQTTLHIGPPAWHPNAEDFLRIWKREDVGGPFLKDGRWITLAPRSHVDVKEFLESNWRNLSLGAGLDPKRAEIISNGAVFKSGYERLLTKLFDTRMNWEI
ncbi:MAG: hypothetical protein PWQ88_320 [Candidatus Methanomethylophilaceae archaeon]|nr:hypothetical protein [Candidatus Methanomethylophilaceae archaeon]MDI3542309.1 hypothetical protein [Candidatus Methanomethylophilaceae archaeon]